MPDLEDPQRLADTETRERIERLAKEAADLAQSTTPAITYQDETSYCPVSAVYGRKDLKITVDPMVAEWSDDEIRAIFAQRLCGADLKGARGLPVAGTAALMCAFFAALMGIIGPLCMIGSTAKLVPWLACESVLAAPSLLVYARKARAWRQADARYIEAGGYARPLISAMRKSQRGDRDVTRAGAVAEFFAGFFFSGLSPECAIRGRLKALRPAVRSDFAKLQAAATSSATSHNAGEQELRVTTLQMARDGSWSYPAIAKSRPQLTLE